MLKVSEKSNVNFSSQFLDSIPADTLPIRPEMTINSDDLNKEIQKSKMAVTTVNSGHSRSGLLHSETPLLILLEGTLIRQFFISQIFENSS